MKKILRLLLLVLFAPLCATSSLAADWWNMPDADFVQLYGKLALGSQQEQSQFAWMMFARLAQPAQLGDKTFRVWELWPSNADTFSPNVTTFAPANKVRTRPHLQEPKVFLLNGKPAHALSLAPSFKPGEEVTRNPIAYNYITDPKRPINTRAGIVAAINAKSPIDLPVAAIETKGNWITDQVAPGMYQINDGTTTYALNGLHTMAEIKPDPQNQHTSPAPRWFWTTFEFTGH